MWQSRHYHFMNSTHQYPAPSDQRQRQTACPTRLISTVYMHGLSAWRSLRSTRSAWASRTATPSTFHSNLRLSTTANSPPPGPGFVPYNHTYEPALFKLTLLHSEHLHIMCSWAGHRLRSYCFQSWRPCFAYYCW